MENDVLQEIRDFLRGDIDRDYLSLLRNAAVEIERLRDREAGSA